MTRDSAYEEPIDISPEWPKPPEGFVAPPKDYDTSQAFVRGLMKNAQRTKLRFRCEVRHCPNETEWRITFMVPAERIWSRRMRTSYVCAAHAPMRLIQEAKVERARVRKLISPWRKRYREQLRAWMQANKDWQEKMRTWGPETFEANLREALRDMGLEPIA